MADPTKYDPEYSFSGWQATNPSKPLPASQVDNELANIQLSVDELVDAVKDVRRSDGALKNGVVTLDSLAADVLAQMGDGMAAAEAAAEGYAADAESARDDAQAAASAAAASAAKLSGTSTTSVTLGLGTKAFTTQSGKMFVAGVAVIASSAAAPTTDYMTGIVSSYSSTTLQVDVTAFGGSGSRADWNIFVAGVPGAKGDDGAAGAGTGDMLRANNLSDLTDAAAARGNLGLGDLAVLDTVGMDQIDNNAVVTDKIAANAVTTGKLAAGVVNGLTTVTAVAGDYVMLGDTSDSGNAKKALVSDITALVTSVFVDRVYAESVLHSTLATTTPADDTIPQVLEGNEVLTASITPKSTTNRLRVSGVVNIGAGASGIQATVHIHVNGASNAVYATGDNIDNTLRIYQIPYCFEYAPGSVSAQAISVRVGLSSGTAYLNGVSTGRYYGGVSKSTLVIDEIKA